jgi:glycerol kinase
MAYLASLDQSTTSTKFSIFSGRGELIAKEVIEHKQICPREGLLEHDPLEIIANTQLCISRTVEQMRTIPGFSVEQIRGVGVTNQRETVVCWNREGKPYYNAIVWCDTRCKDICEEFKATHGEFKLKTGLPVSTYFSMFKILWLIKHVP